MEDPDHNRVRDMRHDFSLTGAVPRGNRLAAAVGPYKVKVFKSGNSLAVRMPKALGLDAGMELELTILGVGRYVLNTIDPPGKKLDISGFWGKAKSLKVPDRRDFDERPSTIAARLTKGEV